MLFGKHILQRKNSFLSAGKFVFDEPGGLNEKLNCHYAMQSTDFMWKKFFGCEMQ